MKKQVLVRILGTISLSTVVIVAFGNGCSQDFKVLESSGEFSSEAAGAIPQVGATPNSELEVIPGTKTASLVYSNQVLSHMAACAGVAQPSDQTVQTFESKKGAISVSGSANSITSPMLMAVTNIAGEVCNDLIEQELSQGMRIFKDINLNANATPDKGLLSDVISRLALSCWQRRDTDSERNAILDMINDNVGATEMGASRKASLLICTSMLSSLDALLN